MKVVFSRYLVVLKVKDAVRKYACCCFRFDDSIRSASNIQLLSVSLDFHNSIKFDLYFFLHFKAMFFQVCLCFVAITLMINVQNGDCYLRGDETNRVLQIPASSLSGSFSSGSGSNGFSNVRCFDHLFHLLKKT